MKNDIQKVDPFPPAWPRSRVNEVSIHETTFPNGHRAIYLNQLKTQCLITKVFNWVVAAFAPADAFLSISYPTD